MMRYIILLLVAYCITVESNLFEIVIHKYEALSYREIVDMENMIYKFSFCLCQKESRKPNDDQNCKCQMNISGKNALESAPKAIYSASCLHNPEDDKCLFARIESETGKYVYISVKIGNKQLTNPEWQSLNLVKKKRTSHLAANIDKRLIKIDYITYEFDSDGGEVSSFPEAKPKQESETDSKLNRFKIKSGRRTTVASTTKITDPTTTTPMAARRIDLHTTTTPFTRKINIQTTTTPLPERPTTRTTTTSVVTRRPDARIAISPIFNTRANIATSTLRPPIESPNSLPRQSFIMPGGDPQGRFIQSLTDATIFLQKLGKIQRVPPQAFDVKEFRKAMVIMHNRLRYMHGAKFVVNDQMTEVAAQSWANKLAQRESCLVHEHRKGFGENLFYFAADYLTDPYSMAEAVVRTFYSEGKGYDYRRFRRHHVAVGHFTQMIWDSSTKLGVGVAIKRFSGRRTNGCQPRRAHYMMYIVVKYTPAGNVQSQMDYFSNVKPVMRKL